MSYPPHLNPPGQYPPPGAYAPPYGWPAPAYPPAHTYPPPPSDPNQPRPPMYPYYVPGTMMVPVPIAPMPMAPGELSQPTYITNHIYHGDNSGQTQVVERSGELDWVPTTATTASHLTGRAVVGGHEGWDGSPLWVIRAWHSGDQIPGKLSVRHNHASVMYDGKEIPVQNIEVLCASPENLRWIPASNGNIPPGAVTGGRTSTGEALYVGRARYQLSLTPGKIHPSHKSCYIGFSGAEVAVKMYDVLCRVS